MASGRVVGEDEEGKSGRFRTCQLLYIVNHKQQVLDPWKVAGFYSVLPVISLLFFGYHVYQKSSMQSVMSGYVQTSCTREERSKEQPANRVDKTNMLN